MRTLALGLMGMLAAGSAQAATNLVQNGEFEAYTLTAGQQTQTAGYVGFQVTYGGYENAVDGWSSTQDAAHPKAYNLYFYDNDTATAGDAFSEYGGEQQRPNANFTPRPGGGGFMVLDGDPDFTGPLTQTINGLVVGKNYKLSFWWAGGELSNRVDYQTIALGGTFGGSNFSTATYNNSAAPGAAGSFSGWQQVDFTFKATSASQVLSFLAAGTPQNNLPPVAFLDGVSLTAVPEPAAWALMLLGFGSLGATLRRRRAGQAAA